MEQKWLLGDYLARLGLEPEMADIYMALVANSPQTISQLARSSGVERTRIYRLLDDLQDSGLVAIDEESARGLLRAAPLSNLEVLLASKEQQLHDLRASLPTIVSSLQLSSARAHDTSVQFYRGDQGLRQLLWNQTRYNGENLSILADTIQTRTDARFFDRWAERLNQQGGRLRSITGPSFEQQLHDWYGPKVTVRLQRWEGRSVAPEIYTISTNTLIYGDVVAYYGWNGHETFGVELTSPSIAAAQRQLFELLWEKAVTI